MNNHCLKIVTGSPAFLLFRNWFRRALLVLAALALASGCSTASREMSHIVRERRVHRGELDVSGLPENPPNTIIPGGPGIEEYYLPGPRGTDRIHFRVVLDHRKQLYWIIRYGGFAGTAWVFGPGKAYARDDDKDHHGVYEKQ
jgi:hypothetical protein